VVCGLPRGGVPVAAEVAAVLGAPLDVLLVRKLGVPGQPELALGAIGEGGVRVVNDAVRRVAQVDERALAEIEARERTVLARMARTFRRAGPPVPLQGRTVVVVDDGIATGSTARAACLVAHAHGASRVVLAAPVIPASTRTSLRDVADEIVCVASPERFVAIGQWYEDFGQLTDDEVIDLLDHAGAVHGEGTPCALELPTGTTLPGTLLLPPAPEALVVFAHGSGSNRSSPRNRAVARRLAGARLGSLLVDLLTPAEAEDRRRVFDIELLSERLAHATRRAGSSLPGAPIGYFGASTGAAAALLAAAAPGSAVRAVVSRGGRPDLVGPRLRDVRAPTLLIVGEGDREVLALNRRASATMRCTRELTVVAGATHLFEEPGALEQVADLAASWFSTHLLGHRAARHRSGGLQGRPHGDHQGTSHDEQPKGATRP